MSRNVVVIGTQWGDEGKGKVTNYLSHFCDVVVRFQGGDNAGHTIKFSGQTYALHIIPSGIFNNAITNVIGNGVVLNPRTFVSEVDKLKKSGFTCHNLLISERAHVIFDYHQTLDGLLEQKLGDQQIGTTKRGIGPTYKEKIARLGIRVADFISDDFPGIFTKKLALINEELQHLGHQVYDIKATTDEYVQLAQIIKPYVSDTVTYLNEAYKNGQKILFEGAQGTLLDIDFGTYPFVTSSNASAAGVSAGTGLGPTCFDEVIGITKAYATRVGRGPFPTEFEDETAKMIREIGREYGTTTKRPRRIGWLDGVILKYSAMVNGLTGLSVMLLDVLSGVKTLKIATSYLLKGQKIDTLPARIEDFALCVPQYEELPGWVEDINHVTKYEDLPQNAQNYLKRIEELTQIKIVIISVGPDQKQTIIRKDIFAEE